MDLTILIPCKNDKINLNNVIKDIKSIHTDINILVVVEKGPGLEKLKISYPEIKIESLVKLEMDGDKVVLLN